MAKSKVNFIVNKKQTSSAAVRKASCMSWSSSRQSNIMSRSSPSTRLSAIFAKSTVHSQSEFDTTKQKVQHQVKTNTLSKPGLEINLETNNLISQKV